MLKKHREKPALQGYQPYLDHHFLPPAFPEKMDGSPQMLQGNLRWGICFPQSSPLAVLSSVTYKNSHSFRTHHTALIALPLISFQENVCCTSNSSGLSLTMVFLIVHLTTSLCSHSLYILCFFSYTQAISIFCFF